MSHGSSMAAAAPASGRGQAVRGRGVARRMPADELGRMGDAAAACAAASCTESPATTLSVRVVPGGEISGNLPQLIAAHRDGHHEVLLLSASVFEGVEKGELKRAAPTRSARSLRPGTKDTAARPSRPRCFGSARAQEAASVSSIKWDEHGAGLFWGSWGRSRHGGDPRPHVQQRSDRQFDCARFASILGASRSRGGRSTACSRARARCRGGCGARREGARGGSSHLELRRAGRRARREEAKANEEHLQSE